MEKSVGRFVAIAYALAALVLAQVLQRMIHGALVFGFGVADYALFHNNDLPVSTVAGYVLAGIAGVVCWVNPELKRLSNEVAAELSKVKWPSRQETWAATVVVIVTVALGAVYLGVFDALWLYASNAILSIPNGTATHG